MHDTWEALEERLQKKELINGVRTNFGRLDGLTQGLQPEELIILAARPSVGKTSFALNIARNAAVAARVPGGHLLARDEQERAHPTPHLQ